MKKLPVFLLTVSMLLSSVCGFIPSNAQAVTEIDSDFDNTINEKIIYHTSAETSNQGTVRMSGTAGDEITVFFKLRQADRVQGLLSELKFNKSYVSYNGYDQYYTDTFVNQLNDSFMMFAVLFDAAGTSVTDESEIIAFKFTAKTDITYDDVCVTYNIKEFYNSDMFELNYDALIIEAVNENGNSSDAPHIHSAVIHEAKSPTCTEPGWGEWAECSVCGEILVPKISVPATGHTEVIDKAVEATCTTEGKTAGSHCSVCGTVIKAQQTVPMKEHNYVDGKCTMCGKKKEGSTDTDKKKDSDTDTSGGNDEPAKNLLGDVSSDGFVTSKDALIVLRAAIKIIKLDDTQKKLGDVNGDGRVNATDALLIQQYSIGTKKDGKIGKPYE